MSGLMLRLQQPLRLPPPEPVCEVRLSRQVPVYRQAKDGR